ncbi:hypothetical protein ACJJTC_010631 [Scirpophaga incertulas]
MSSKDESSAGAGVVAWRSGGDSSTVNKSAALSRAPLNWRYLRTRTPAALCRRLTLAIAAIRAYAIARLIVLQLLLMNLINSDRFSSGSEKAVAADTAHSFRRELTNKQTSFPLRRPHPPAPPLLAPDQLYPLEFVSIQFKLSSTLLLAHIHVQNFQISALKIILMDTTHTAAASTRSFVEKPIQVVNVKRKWLPHSFCVIH